MKHSACQLIGVIHLPPLPGAPRARPVSPVEVLRKAGMRAVREAIALEEAGFHALILENFGDTPFYKSQVPPETVAAMSIIAAAVREAVSIPVGINVLRNDGKSALSIAGVAGCDFIRVNVLSGVAATDQGLIEGEAASLLRERQRLRADSIRIWADVLVKHAVTLSTSEIELAIEEAALRGGAHAVILTGETTGRSVEFDHLRRAAKVCHEKRIPLVIGSGITPDSWRSWRRQSSKVVNTIAGVIVGSSIRKGGQAGRPLDRSRMMKLVKTIK